MTPSYTIGAAELYCGDALAVLKELPAGVVQCVVTSPPYWGLRDYGVAGQLGLEQSPDEYVAKMVEVFREVRRVMRQDATLFLNIGDSYANAQPRGHYGDQGDTSTGAHGESIPPGDWRCWNLKPKDMAGIPWRLAFALQADGWWLRQDGIERVKLYCPCGCGYELEEEVWRYSQDREIVWEKPNPMPESVTDRCTKAHDYIFLLTKSARYYWDAEAIKEHSLDTAGITSVADDGTKRYRQPWTDSKGRDDATDLASWASRYGSTTSPGGRNKRSVWTMATQGYPGAHFATFPVELPLTCIKAGTSEKGCCPKCGAPWRRVLTKNRKTTRPGLDTKVRGDRPVEGHRDPERHVTETRTVGWQPTCTCGGDPVPCLVLDPFVGSGTTGEAALTLGRRLIGIDLSPEYIELARKRIVSASPQKLDVEAKDAPLFGEPT